MEKGTSRAIRFALQIKHSAIAQGECVIRSSRSWLDRRHNDGPSVGPLTLGRCAKTTLVKSGRARLLEDIDGGRALPITNNLIIVRIRQRSRDEMREGTVQRNVAAATRPGSEVP